MNIKSLLSSKQSKQAILLYVSTLLGVVLGFGASIINTRFLDPSNYGDVRYVQNIITFVSSFLLLGYFQSGSRLLALSQDDAHSRSVRGVLFRILIITTLILMICCGIFALYFIGKENISSLFLVSIPVCGYPLFLSYVNTVSQGDNQIGRIAAVRLIPSFLYVLLGYLIYSNFGASSKLMVLLQWGLYTFVIFIIILSSGISFKNGRENWIALKEENRGYGFQLYIGALVMVATNYIAGISLGAFNEDNSQVAFYTLALTLTTPLAMLPAIIGTTFFKRFTGQDRIPAKVLKSTILLTIASCAVFVVMIKPLVSIFYDEHYSVVGTYSIILSIGFCVHGLGDMLNRFLGSHGKGQEIRNASVANGLFKVFGYTVLVYFFNTEGALVTNIICSFIYSSMMFAYYKKYIRKSQNNEN